MQAKTVALTGHGLGFASVAARLPLRMWRGFDRAAPQWRCLWQVYSQNGVDNITGVLSTHYMFVSVPRKLAVSDLIRLMKGRSSRLI